LLWMEEFGFSWFSDAILEQSKVAGHGWEDCMHKVGFLFYDQRGVRGGVLWVRLESYIESQFQNLSLAHFHSERPAGYLSEMIQSLQVTLGKQAVFSRP
jgi:hypothetical protein